MDLGSNWIKILTREGGGCELESFCDIQHIDGVVDACNRHKVATLSLTDDVIVKRSLSQKFRVRFSLSGCIQGLLARTNWSFSTDISSSRILQIRLSLFRP